jgi:hypothetical protein
MTASRSPAVGVPPARRAGGPTALVSPVIDCEPTPVGDPPALNTAARCVSPTPAALRRGTARPLRPVPHAAVHDAIPPQAAIAFADSALRRVLEVIDRRRPVAQLRPLLAPALIDRVVAMTQAPRTGCPARQDATAATLRKLRLRMVDGDGQPRAEVFGTYRRGSRVLAIAACIELDGERWRIVALQMV